MAYPISKTDIAKTLYDMNRTYDGQQIWRNAYADVSLNEQRELSNLQYDYSKALNDAYITSMEQRNQILDTSLGTGYKSKLIEQNEMNLQNAFEEYRKNYLQNKSTVESSYDKLTSQIDTSLLQESENYAKYNDAFYDYLSYLNVNVPELSNDINWSKYYTTDELSGVNRLKSNTELYSELLKDGYLTDEGKQMYIQLANNQSGMTFQDFLAQSNKYSDLVEWAADNESYNNKFFFENILGIPLVDGQVPLYESAITTTSNESNRQINQLIRDGDVESLRKSMPTTFNDVDWTIEGLGTGRNNDDLNVTIAGEQFNLRTTKFNDENGDIVKALNLIATGDENKTPATSVKQLTNKGTERNYSESWRGDTYADTLSDEYRVDNDPLTSNKYKPGKLIVYQGNMYLYTTKGWKQLISEDDDEDDITRAITKYSSEGKLNIMTAK